MRLDMSRLSWKKIGDTVDIDGKPYKIIQKDVSSNAYLQTEYTEYIFEDEKGNHFLHMFEYDAIEKEVSELYDMKPIKTTLVTKYEYEIIGDDE